LKELGWVEGRQYTLIIRDTKGDAKAVEMAAQGLERDNVDLIYSVATSVTIAVKRATSRVPIVFNAGSDPVAMGLVESYRKPGGRLTGVHSQLADLTAKRLELLREIVPGVRRVVAFYTPENPASQEAMKSARDAAHQLKIDLVERPVRSTEEMRAALDALRPGEFGALFYVASALVTSATEEAAHDVPGAREHQSRRPRRLRQQLPGGRAALGQACPARASGHSGGGDPGGAGLEALSGAQPQDGKGDRPDHPAPRRDARGRSDPMTPSPTLAGALGVKRDEVVALVGGGGKSAAMFRLAREMASGGGRVVTTTTTHIFASQIALAPAHLLDADATRARLLAALEAQRHVLVTGPTNPETKRAAGISPERFRELRAWCQDACLLTEADGSRMRPFKAPAEHEPVIPAESTLVLLVVGADVLGQPLDADHVHRPERVSALSGTPVGAPVTSETVARVLTHHAGGRKDVPAGARLVVLINKVEALADLAPARDTAARLLREPTIEAVLLTTLRHENPVLEICAR
jgi:probable selenium-dependent hydroxylase accessory protein YqeC